MGTSLVSSTSTLVALGGIVDNATFLASFCLGVGKHDSFVTTAEVCRNAKIPCIILESVDCRC